MADTKGGNVVPSPAPNNNEETKVLKKAVRSPSLLGDIKQLLGVDTETEDSQDSPPRSRRGLFQSLSSSNLHQPPSSSLPPQIPRSFYLGDLDIPARLRGTRSQHSSPCVPAPPPCSLKHGLHSHHSHSHRHCEESNQRTYKSLSETRSHCATPVTDSELGSGPPRLPLGRYMADTGHHLETVELADTNPSNSARHTEHQLMRTNAVPLRRHRSTQALDTCAHLPAQLHTCHVPTPPSSITNSARHSVHFDSAAHAAITGLETLDFPPRKKTWPPDGSRFQHQHRDRSGQKDRTALDRGDYHSQESESCCSAASCPNSLVNSVVYQKMMSIAGQHRNQCIVMCCCAPHTQPHAHAHQPRAAGPGGAASRGSSGHPAQCVGDPPSGHTTHPGEVRCEKQRTGLQPPACSSSSEGQSGQGGAGQGECGECGAMVHCSRTAETSGLWAGVSGVPGLGVSIPRSVSSSRPVSSLDEWDQHDLHSLHGRQHAASAVTSDRRASTRHVSSKAALPRVASSMSPRSSSCRSSGRSTASRGSSALSQGLSNGSSSSSSKYSNRSDSGLSASHQPARGHPGSESKSIQSPVNLFHKSSNAKRKGNLQLHQSGHASLPPATCECVCTCGDPVPPKPVRRVMFSDDTCSCDTDSDTPTNLHKSLPVTPGFSEPSRGDCCGCSSSRLESREEERRSHDAAFRSISPVPNNHYKSPHEVDGEYSYAYSDSVSPAFLIRVGASMNYSGSGEEEESDSKENIYEEIKDKHEEEPSKDPAKESRKSSSSSAETADTGAGTKSKFQKALEAVTRRSSRSLDAGSEKSFHLSISKGRKKSLIDRAKVDWDCYGPGLHSKLNKSSSDMLTEVNTSHDKVMSQLKLDVENMLMPPPSPPGDDTQDDSGFHSGGHSSNTSYSPKTKRKSIIKPAKGLAKRSESQPGRMNRCESIDFKDAGFKESQRKQSEVFRTRSRIISEHTVNYHAPVLGHAHYGPPSSIYSVAPPMLVAPPPPLPNAAAAGKKSSGSAHRSYLSKLVSFPFMGGSKSQAPPSIYGKNNNLPPPPHRYEDESGRNFYL